MGSLEAVREVEHAAKVSVESGRSDSERLRLERDNFIEDLCRAPAVKEPEWHASGEIVPVPLSAIPDGAKQLKEQLVVADFEIDRLKKQLAVAKGERDLNARSWREVSMALVEAKRERPTDKFARGVSRFDAEETHVTTLCLDRAGELVCGPRADDYGDPAVAFEAVAVAWEAYRQAADRPFDARDVAQLMIIYKAFRDRNRRKQDNPDDQAGLAQVASWIGDPRES